MVAASRMSDGNQQARLPLASIASAPVTGPCPAAMRTDHPRIGGLQSSDDGRPARQYSASAKPPARNEIQQRTCGPTDRHRRRDATAARPRTEPDPSASRSSWPIRRRAAGDAAHRDGHHMNDREIPRDHGRVALGSGQTAICQSRTTPSAATLLQRPQPIPSFLYCTS